MTKQQIQQREQALGLSGGVCAVCGKPLNSGAPQYAHKIANTKTNRNKYGSFIIDNVLNGAYVCSLGCNQRMNIGFNKGAILDLIAEITLFEMRKFCNGKQESN